VKTDVIVIGGGAIGLLCAYQLALTGKRVRLLERSQVGSEASWAGGGIVSPLYPWRYSPAVTALAHWSQEHYPALVEQIHKRSGVDPELHSTGLYWLDMEDQEAALRWAQHSGKPLSEVPVSQAYAAVPALGCGFARALHMPGLANVRNPRLLKSLRGALAAMTTVKLQEHCAVRGFVRAGGHVVGVTTAQGEWLAEHVVLAAGAWSRELLQSLGLALAVEPVKGQMILFKCAADFLPCMLLARGRYAIPRRDGHILIGSTLERVGFDKATTQEARISLQASAEELLPALAAAQLVGHWAGLRPASPEGIPFIGPVPGHQGLWLNCGHYRNGLVLAPAACQLLGDLLLGRKPIVDPQPYLPEYRLQAVMPRTGEDL
jgi:glycine oxidase